MFSTQIDGAASSKTLCSLCMQSITPPTQSIIVVLVGEAFRALEAGQEGLGGGALRGGGG